MYFSVYIYQIELSKERGAKPGGGPCILNHMHFHNEQFTHSLLCFSSVSQRKLSVIVAFRTGEVRGHGHLGAAVSGLGIRVTDQ